MKNTTLPQNLEPLLQEFKQQTKTQAIRLTTQRSDQITATSSKFGGTPYLPKNYTYPTCPQGNPLKLLAQLNFDELPHLPNFPTSGILQFFVLPDNSIGFDHQNSVNNGKHKVIYHKEILPESEIMTDFPKIVVMGFPFEGEFLLKGELIDAFINPDVYSFDYKFTPFCEKHNIDYDINNDETFDEIHEMLYEVLENEDQHLVGGYPSFCQGDPRLDNRKMKKYDTLIFKMSSDYTPKSQKDVISWGDAGIANFFIKFDDLQNLKFNDVFYTWDCS